MFLSLHKHIRVRNWRLKSQIVYLYLVKEGKKNARCRALHANLLAVCKRPQPRSQPEAQIGDNNSLEYFQTKTRFLQTSSTQRPAVLPKCLTWLHLSRPDPGANFANGWLHEPLEPQRPTSLAAAGPLGRRQQTLPSHELHHQGSHTTVNRDC